MTITEFLTCETAGMSLETILRLLLKVDADGNIYFNTNQRQQRAAIEIVTTGGTPILFSSAMPDANYILVYRCYNALNENIEVMITNKTANGFTATPVINGTLEYFVTEAI